MLSSVLKSTRLGRKQIVGKLKFPLPQASSARFFGSPYILQQIMRRDQKANFSNAKLA
jgi:hypothetical protein